jgi:hypothetical protein
VSTFESFTVHLELQFLGPFLYQACILLYYQPPRSSYRSNCLPVESISFFKMDHDHSHMDHGTMDHGDMPTCSMHVRCLLLSICYPSSEQNWSSIITPSLITTDALYLVHRQPLHHLPPVAHLIHAIPSGIFSRHSPPYSGLRGAARYIEAI